MEITEEREKKKKRSPTPNQTHRFITEGTLRRFKCCRVMWHLVTRWLYMHRLKGMEATQALACALNTPATFFNNIYIC